MLVLNMNSKRQRRPNVRLGEIGDVSAAFACGISHRIETDLRQKRWKWEHDDFQTCEASERNPILGLPQKSLSEVLVSDSGVSPRISADMQHNRENKNPNSLKPVLESGNLDEIDFGKSSLEFGTITGNYRLMKRRRSSRGNCGVFGGAWNSKISPEFSRGDGRESGEEFCRFTSSRIYNFDCFKDSSCHETSATTSKEVHENDTNEPIFNEQMQGNPWNEGSYSEGNKNAFTQSFGGCEKIKIGADNASSVRRWLEGLGFHKYASIFEMHEVDEEALPLLTLEDLMEMGVLAVGTRRKLYTAILQLREGRERNVASQITQ